MSEIQELYKERSRYAQIESDCQDAKKYVRYNGLFYRLFSWLERYAAKYRADVQLKIDELKGYDNES